MINYGFAFDVIKIRLSVTYNAFHFAAEINSEAVKLVELCGEKYSF